MAYYDQMKKGNKRQAKNSGRWEEEGSRYRGEYAPKRDRDSFRSDNAGRPGRPGKKFNGAGEHHQNADREWGDRSSFDSRNDRFGRGGELRKAVLIGE